jgi:hypothetical protein
LNPAPSSRGSDHNGDCGDCGDCCLGGDNPEELIIIAVLVVCFFALFIWFFVVVELISAAKDAQNDQPLKLILMCLFGFGAAGTMIYLIGFNHPVLLAVVGVLVPGLAALVGSLVSIPFASCGYSLNASNIKQINKHVSPKKGSTLDKETTNAVLGELKSRLDSKGYSFPCSKTFAEKHNLKAAVSFLKKHGIWRKEGEKRKSVEFYIDKGCRSDQFKEIFKTSNNYSR